MTANDVAQPISKVLVFGAHDKIEEFAVGSTAYRIEMTSRPGLHCDIPYVRVWGYQNRHVIAEFCLHNVAGLYYFERDL